MINKFIIITLVLICAFCPKALAADKRLELSIDNKEISLSGSIRLDIIFPGLENAPEPKLPEIDGFKANYLRSYNMASKTESGMVRSTRHTYVLMPQETGLFQVGPFEFSAGGDRYISETLIVRVGSGIGLKDKGSGTASKEEEFYAKDNAFLLIATGKNRVYVNETFPVIAGLYYKDIHITDIEYPTVKHGGFSISEFLTPQASRKKIKGYDFRVVAFRSKAFATKPGELKLGPATIMCKMQTGSSSSLSGGFKTTSLQLDSTLKNIEVLPLPALRKPDNFSGAIGDFKFDVTVEPKGYVDVGDAITISMQVSGEGNLDIISEPYIEESAELTLYDVSIKEEAETHKIFEQVVVPKSTKAKQIPKITFSYFNPKKEEYFTITRGPYPIEVFETKKSQKAKIVEEPVKGVAEYKREPIGKDIIYIKDNPGRFQEQGVYLYKDKQFLFMHTFPLIFYLSTLVLYKRHEKLKNDIRYARYKFAYKKAKRGLKEAYSLLTENNAEEFYGCLFAIVQEYFGDKFNLPPGGITADIVDRILKPKGVDIELLGKTRSFFNDCDIARFTPAHYEKKNMLNIFGEAEEIVTCFKNI